MPAIDWIKITTTMFDDEKIQLIEKMPDSDTILVIWIKILTLAGKCNASGHLLLSERIPYNDEMLATIFRRNVTSVRMALEVFQKFGMIELEETIYITNWGRHQNIESLDRVREQNRLRQAKHKENKKLKLIPYTDCANVIANVTGNEEITLGNAPRKKKREVRIKTFAGEPSPAPTLVSDSEKQKQDDRFTWFKNWFVWACQDITGAKYVFTVAEGPLLARLLKATNFSDMLQRGSYYLSLAEEQRFPRGAPSIKGFNAMFNQIAGKDGRAACQSDGLLPKELQKLKDFTPWKEGSSDGHNAAAA